MAIYLSSILIGIMACVIHLLLKRERNLAKVISTQDLHIDMLNHRVSYLTSKESEATALVNDLLNQIEIAEAKLNRFRAETLMAVNREMPYALANVRMEILKDVSGNVRNMVFLRNIALARCDGPHFEAAALKHVDFHRYSMELANPKDIPAELWIDDLVAKVRQKVMHDFGVLNKPEPKETANAHSR